MRNLAGVLAALALGACGDEQRDGELTIQTIQRLPEIDFVYARSAPTARAGRRSARR